MKSKGYDWNNPTHRRLYRIWCGMKSRCSAKPGERWYANYSSRGINVCDEWKHDFLSFYNWSICNGYQQELTIDRIDNDGDYSPRNCRWATVKQQLNNTRVNHRITCRNETHTISEWAKILGVNSGAIYRRIYKGWSAEDALFVPKQRGVDYKDRVGKEELISLVNKAINSGLCKNKNDYIEKVGISRTSFFHTINGGIMSKENTSRVRNFNEEEKK